MNGERVGGCSKGKGHDSERSFCLCWFWPPKDQHNDLFIWSQWPWLELCAEHVMKINKLFFMQSHVGKKKDFKINSKLYWEAMKGTLRVNDGDLVTTEAIGWSMSSRECHFLNYCIKKIIFSFQEKDYLLKYCIMTSNFGVITLFIADA